MSALEADDDVRLLRQPVDNLAFSLVTPLGADDNDVRHLEMLFPDIPGGQSQASRPVSPRSRGVAPGIKEAALRRKLNGSIFAL